MNALLIRIVCMSIWLWQYSAYASNVLTQNDLDRVGNELIINYEIISNTDSADICQRDIGAPQCFSGQVSLTFPMSLPDNDWKIYFGSRKTIVWQGSSDFHIQHINGDLHTITFVGKMIIPGKTYVIPFKSKGDVIAELQALPNYFIASISQPLFPRLIKSTAPQIDPDSELVYYPYVKPFLTNNQRKRAATDASHLATPEMLYQRYENINAFSGKSKEDSYRIIPQVKKSTFKNSQVSLKDGLFVAAEDDKNRELVTAFQLLQKEGVNISEVPKKGSVKVSLIMDKKINSVSQGYELNITSNKIQITAETNTGFFYGLCSIAQLLDDELNLPIVKINDSPRYDFRGVLLDVARNFHSKAFILNLLDQMAILKLNKFHLHLADDEAWRLEIPDLPELTDMGAYRCYDPLEQNCLSPQLGSGPTKETEVNGYFSTEEYIEILKYADARHIEVIPALDMPGHSRAAIKSMESRYRKYMERNLSQKANEYKLTEIDDKSTYQSIQHYNDNTLNPCIDSTYHFIDKILVEVVKLHQRAGVPLKRYHIGADETAGAWRESPACKQLIQKNKDIHRTEDITAYFIETIAQKINARGIIPGVWGDGLDHANKDNLPGVMQVNVWGLLPDQSHNRAHYFVNLGFDTVLSLPDVLYFDFPYQADSKEQGNAWGSRSIDEFKVFQFMPDNLPAHAEIWPDALGHTYSATEEVALDNGRHFTGIQAQLWSETTRTDNAAGYMYFPRLVAFAERAWHQAAWEVPYHPGQVYSPQTQHFTGAMKAQQLQDWENFSHSLIKKILPQFVKDDMFFKFPTPGAKIENGILYANSMFSDLTIEYRLLSDNEVSEWKVYKKPIQLEKSMQLEKNVEIELRNRLAGLSRTGRIITIKWETNKNAASN